MPHKNEPKKTARDMTTEELARRFFPPEVIEKAKQIAEGGDKAKKPRKEKR